MLLYFALDDEDTCFHSSKIFNNLEDLYAEIVDYRNNVHFIYRGNGFKLREIIKID